MRCGLHLTSGLNFLLFVSNVNFAPHSMAMPDRIGLRQTKPVLSVGGWEIHFAISTVHPKWSAWRWWCMSEITYRCARSRACCLSVASTFVMGRCGSGGTGSVGHSPPRSGSGEFIADHTYSGAGTWTRYSGVSMARQIICGARLIMKVKCSSPTPRNAGIVRLRLRS